jgi:hypothetical protein
MKWSYFFSSAVGRKIVMATTGIFLVLFLIVHVGLNACIFADWVDTSDNGEMFNKQRGKGKPVAIHGGWLILALSHGTTPGDRSMSNYRWLSDIIIAFKNIAHIIQVGGRSKKTGQAAGRGGGAGGWRGGGYHIALETLVAPG